MKNWWKHLTITQWLPSVSKNDLKADIIAGFTVGIILIPQGIAYAMIAGLPPIYGLYGALIPQLVYMLLGTSPAVAIGPVAMDSLLVAAGISSLGLNSLEETISVAILFSLITGLVQLLLGVFRMGFVIQFLSRPVITGFTSGVALIILLSQLKNLFGVPVESSHLLYITLFSFFENISLLSLITMVSGGVAIGFLVLMKKYLPKWPAALLVVIIAIVIMHFFGHFFKSIEVVGAIPSGLPDFKIPQLSWSLFKELLPISITLGVIGFLETFSIGQQLNTQYKKVAFDANKELIAIGASNLLGSLFQTYPSTASFSRSAVNKESGVKTGLAALFSVLLIVLVLLFFTPLFYQLPKTILAAIIVVSVYKLIDIPAIKSLWKINQIDFFMAVLTFLGTLFIGIKEGVFIGVFSSLIMLVFRTSRPHIAVLGRIPNTHFFRNVGRFDQVEADKDVLIMRFDSILYFANAVYFKNQLRRLAEQKGADLKLIIIDGECINGLDATGVAVLDEELQYFNKKEVEVYFTNVKGPVRDAMKRAGLTDTLSKNQFFISNHDAIHYFKTRDESQSDKLSDYIRQSNP